MTNQLNKILYVHYQACERDGSSTHTAAFEYWFGQLCAERGITFNVVAPPLVSAEGDSPGSFLGRLKHRLARFYLRDFKLLFRQWRRMRGERQMLLREKPSLVITRFDDNTLSILWACRALGVPVVIEVNSPTIEATNAHYRHLPVFKRLFSNDHALFLAQGGFTVTENLTRGLLANAVDKPLVTIPNGVDPARFEGVTDEAAVIAMRERLAITPERVVIGFVGSFAPWHGVGELVQAFELLLQRGLDVHLLLVGQTSASSQAVLERLRQSSLAERVTLSGFIPLAKIPEYLSVMDITTIANTEDYCSPLKLFEYMAMGKASVSVDTAAVSHIMRPEQEGLLFERGDVDGLASALERLVTDVDLRERLGVAARKRVTAEFTWRHNAERVFELGSEVCQLNLPSDAVTG